MKRNLAARIIGSISFANLCVLNLWHDTQRLDNPAVAYFREVPRNHTLLYATLLLILLLSLFFFLLAGLASTLRNPFAKRVVHLGFILAFLYPIRLLHYVMVWSDLPEPWMWIARMALFACYGGVVGAAMWFCVTADQTPVRALVRLNLVVSPLLLLVLASHGIYLLTKAPAAADFTPKHLTPGGVSKPSAERVVWVIFDEFDFEATFEHRPRGLQLPELDRLRQEALSAVNMYPPFSDTLGAIPSVINGRAYQDVRVADVRSLRLTFGGKTETWGSADSVFSRLHADGFRSAVIGCYHPYCRILGDALTECTFVPATKYVLLLREAYAAKLGVQGTVRHLLMQQLRAVPFLPIEVAPSLSEIARGEQVSEFVRVHTQAINYAADPTLDVVYAHYPIPHPDGVYDRSIRMLTTSSSSSYLDNLALVDRVVGELRQTLESKNLWNRTVVVVSSDHALRDGSAALLPNSLDFSDSPKARGLARIPFLVRIPGDRAGREFAPKLSSIVTSSLVVALAEGRVRDLGQLDAWLKRQASSKGS